MRVNYKSYNNVPSNELTKSAVEMHPFGLLQLIGVIAMLVGDYVVGYSVVEDYIGIFAMFYVIPLICGHIPMISFINYIINKNKKS